MKKLPLIIYNAVVLTALSILFYHFSREPVVPSSSQFPIWLLFSITVFSALLECWVIKLPKYGVIPAADTFYYVIMVTFGPVFLVLCVFFANAVKALYETVIKKQGLELHLFNMIQAPLTFMLGSLIYYKLSSPGYFFTSIEKAGINLLSLAVVAIFCVTFRNSLNTIHRFLEGEMPITYVWSVNIQRIRLYMTTIVPIAVLIIAIYEVSPFSLTLLLFPLALVYASIKRYSDLLYEVKSTLEILASSIEARDPQMIDHAQRVARYSKDIGKVLKMQPEMLEHLESAARMHDLGKVSVADDILMKLEPLSEDEFEAVKKHPELGGEVTGRLSFCAEESKMIRHHHERFDGEGYPDGLKGKEIPLGARIIAVAEAFDVMTTTKEYSKAVTFKEALQELRKKSGTQFDPKVVDAFFEAMKERIDKFE